MKREINISSMGSRFMGRAYYPRNSDAANGFRNIRVTDKAHPYIINWWPPGHISEENTWTHLQTKTSLLQ